MKLTKLNRHISIMLIWLVITLPLASAQATSPPTVSISNVEIIHGQQTIIKWQTNILANGYVEWGNTSNLGTNTTTPQGTLHTATLNTVAGQTYYYRIVSCETTCTSTQTDSFTAGPLFITTSIAPYVRTANIDIPGRTRAGAKVDLYINSVLVRSQNTSTETFIFRNVQLQSVNNVTLRAFFNNEQAEKNFTLRVDSEPPKITVDISKIATQPSVVAKVTTTEPVNLTIKTRRVDAKSPGRPTALTKTSVTNTRVELSWANASGATEYLISRDGIIIGKTTTNTYADTTVGADKQYDYEVIAVNSACMQSEPSATLAVTTPGGTNTQAPIIEVTASCERDAQSYFITASADITVNLVEGENLVTFTATDAAGFESIIEESVIYDLAPPQFLENNLASLNPSYAMQVVVKGKLSEKGSVTVYINDRAAETKKTEDDGTFSIPIMLERGVQVKTDTLAAGLDTGIGYKNKIQLEATDAVGRKTRTEPVDVNYAICGYGTDFDVKIENPVPDVLNPRLMIEGLQQVGIAFSYEYKGSQGVITSPAIVTPIQLSPAAAKEYDNNLVTVSSQSRSKRGKEKTAGEGYVQVTFIPIKDPWTQFGEGKKPNNPTLYDIEDAIASHRMAYKDLKIKECKTPGVGCYRLFFKLEIPYQVTTQSQQYLPEQPLAGQIQQEQKRQVTCIDVEMSIDRRIDPKHLPQGFLKGMSETLGAIIEGVDTVLKPLKTIYQYLFYTCIAGWFISYVPTFLEQYNCKYNAIATAVSGEGKFDEGVAAINACKTEYEGQEKSLENCQACATWKKNKKWVADAYRQICDRVACPAAPSLQHYIKSRANQQLKEINAPKSAAKLTQYSSKTGNKLYQGSDCAAWVMHQGQQVIENQVKQQMQEINKAHQTAKLPPAFTQDQINIHSKAAGMSASPVAASNIFTTTQIEGIYQDWLKHKTDTRTADEQQGVVNCAAPHPATPECCGYEYMNEWGSACGIGGTLVGQGIDTFDEIEQSTCLSVEKANRKTIGEGDNAVSCGGITNALAGFCTAEGTEPIDHIKVTAFSGSTTEGGRISELGIGKASDHFLYILLIPSKTTSSNYEIKLGYIVEKVEFAQTEQSKKIKEEDGYDIQKKNKAVVLTPAPNIQEHFSQTNIENYNAGKLNAAVYEKLRTDLCNAAGKTTNCDVNGKTMYDAVMSKIGKPDQEYIIDPRKGIINAIRCICLPAVISYLQLWRNIMAAVKNCVDTIRYTGDGNPGVCQEMISKYACDLIYEALACFTEKFSVGGGRPGSRDLFGALTSAGSEMSNDIQGRYGGTTMYNAMFTQGQIVKSVCNFAFTGTWSMDFAALADTSIDDFPIESQSFLYPCDRRFVSFNPLTTPSGMTTWIYHFGVFVAAGSDIDIEFALKCSGGYKCSENDGFERGKCDCDTEKLLTIAPTDLPTRAKKNEIVDSAVYYTVAGNPGGTIRYDKAVLTYKWKDGTGKESRKSLECRINQLGGAPNFCRFDMFSGAYRCQFGPEQGGIQIGTPEVSYPHNISQTTGSTPTGVYALNEKLDINVPIRQAYRGQVTETKFLQWEIFGPGGAKVADNTASIMKLDTNGDYSKNIGQGKFEPPVTLLKSWFGATTAPTPGAPTLAEIWSKREGTQTFSSIITSATLTKGTQPSTERKQFVAEFIKQGAQVTYAIYNAGTRQTQGKKFVKGTVIQGCTGSYLSGPINCAIGDTKLTLNVANSVLPAESGEYYEVHLSFNEAAASSGDFCTGDNRYKPVTFTMKLAAYDSNEFGQISEMVALNPATNEEAKTTTTFNAVCVEATDQKFKELEANARGVILPDRVCPEGYIGENTTACMTSCAAPWQQFPGKQCTTGQCCTTPFIKLRINNVEYTPNMQPLPPGNYTFTLSFSLMNESDLGLVETRVRKPFITGSIFEPTTFINQTYQNNIKTYTYRAELLQNSALRIEIPLGPPGQRDEAEITIELPIQQTISVAADDLEKQLRAQLLKQSDETQGLGAHFKFELAKKQTFTASEREGILQKVSKAYTDYNNMKIILENLEKTLTDDAKQVILPYKNALNSLIGELQIRKEGLSQTAGKDWPTYLPETVTSLSLKMDEVFKQGMIAEDKVLPLNRQDFLVNGKNTQFNLMPGEYIGSSGTPWCIYPIGAHYFKEEKCLESKEISDFREFLSSYGAKEIRAIFKKDGKIDSWSNKVDVNFVAPTQKSIAFNAKISKGVNFVNGAAIPQYEERASGNLMNLPLSYELLNNGYGFVRFDVNNLPSQASNVVFCLHDYPLPDQSTQIEGKKLVKCYSTSKEGDSYNSVFLRLQNAFEYYGINSGNRYLGYFYFKEGDNYYTTDRNALSFVK